ncbi:DDE-type integrase/transposase/recombinase [bacterium]|nr:DDE-type integrase/transposase/recombinase [bacterium]
MSDPDPQAMALIRYQVIAPYLAADPPRGQRGALLRQLAARVWTGPDGEPLTVAAETLRTWVRRYRDRGLAGLQDAPRARAGVQILTDEQQELVCRLKREVPQRSLDRIIEIAQGLELVASGTLKRSTVHRVLQRHGLSARGGRVADRKDLDRFEADFPGALWQSDLLVGPWLPDPDKPDAVRRAKLYAFLDDHSRLLLAGRFHFSEALPHLELVMRDAIRAWSLPRRVYYDNGAVYRSGHMAQVVAELGIERIVFTQPYRPMGHGKIEALNRYIRSSFLAELKASSITTLDSLNEAFAAWADQYNSRPHSETGEAPKVRYQRGLHKLRFVDEQQLRQAFLWKETRKADKAGVLTLLGRRFQVSARLAGTKLELRFDPEHLEQVEVWHDGLFVERIGPLQITAHRRPKDPGIKADTSPVEPTGDWLGHLVQQRREQGFVEPTPAQLAERQRAARAEQDDDVVAVLLRLLDDDALDARAAHAWLDRFGPLDPGHVEAELSARLALGERPDRHVTEILDALRGGAA